MSEHISSRHVLDLRGRKPGLRNVTIPGAVPVKSKKSYRLLPILCLTVVTGFTSLVYALGLNAGASLTQPSSSYSEVSAPLTASVINSAYPDIAETVSNQTLQEVLEEAVLAEPGEIAVRVESLKGSSFSAGVNELDKFNPYSTYKLFIAWLVLEKIDKGEWELSKPVLGSKDVGECLENMIVLSDNPCPEAFFAILGGRQEIERRVRSEGFGSTNFVGELGSTVADQVVFLKKLYKGELLGWQATEHLVDLMKEQKFRDGIPLGADAPVADKVGFLHGYLHDSAIVYGSKNIYAISIFTKDSSWASIARISKRVHNFLEE